MVTNTDKVRWKKGLAIVFLLMSFELPQKNKITVYLIGDSTMADKEVKAYPETGWGMPFHYFFDSTVTVENRAKNGRSTRSFIAEGRWQPVVDNLHEGDYVLIQFGHNDEVPTKRSYTTPGDFIANLEKFVNESRSKKAIPVLITPVARRKFDSTGKIEETHAAYTQLVKNVAKKLDVPLIDLDEESQQLVQQFGSETSKYLYNYLSPGENPHYPEGRSDDTHFSELGARKMAEIVLHNIKNLQFELAERIRVVKEKEK
ncbi:rhamnogalacturonan acetylesterase [Ginsengibacter hankyongi]|uniref:Rhamnogalacturonan acetylesterase n=1 Tax=Ginsengibacter hankyongi TaxID=2607284 RepID=A0A5J5IE08_9BACT|nr:rhamnogalacturonan acetylesterase [Ginsengibacter hankyongi]KAA9038047.1 rhamnogalacturonan acetylesterase [Ginsengibacter hankyongi]